MDINKLRELLPAVGTPSYIFDLDEFEKRALLVKKYFGDTVGMCFSIKANPFLLGRMPACFDKIEVCSPGELTVCERTGADMSTVIFSGVNKGFADVERAADDNVGTFTAESPLHLKLVSDAGVRRGKVFPLLLRVTDIKGGSQFGMSEETVFDLIRRRDEYQGVEIVGLHYFTGTAKRKAKPIEKECDYLIDLTARIKAELGFTVQRIEYGTGLAVDYFSDNADAEEEERLASVAPKLKELAEVAELTVEMGRFFAAPCGYYLTKVVDAKTNFDINYAIVDGGMNQLKYNGQLQGMQIPEILHLKDSEPEGEEQPWTLCGSICTTADVLARNAVFTDLEIGDVLVFCRTGAYSCMEGISTFLSRELPVIAEYSEKEGLRILRSMLFSDKLNTPRR
ncbi:diaminopimelate decarboxylase [uncultured Ruminococcus sp.]|uniref:diaminopimelate decarboxylase family protein n=1 Tax=uncultured Ruminococcus sp. TaxID=165186 RepID=UPI00292D966F|nr:diaminopimelate decarboxylase [uncultured Ruminococcus sp.]